MAEKNYSYYFLKPCDRLEIDGKKFVLKKSSQYPYWIIQPDFKDELQTDTAKELYELEDPNEVL